MTIRIRKTARLIALGAVAVVLGATSAHAGIAGDCGSDGETDIIELQLCINMFLGTSSVPQCTACDVSGDGEEVDIIDLQGDINCFLNPDSANCPVVAGGAPTTTPTPSNTSTRTITPTPTQTPTPAGVCGNGFLEEGETCASCAADCAVGPCTLATPAPTVTFRVNWAPPAGLDASSITVLVGYRSNRVSLPGSGTAPASRVTNKPSNSILTVNDLDYALRAVVTKSGMLAPGRLFNINFDRCNTAPAVTAADFGCQVEGCASSFGNIDGCTCTVVTP